MLKLDFWPLNGLDSRVAGKLLLAQMYEELTGEALPPIEKAPRGKPYFPGSDLHFSITTPKPPSSAPSPTPRWASMPRT